MPKTRLAYRFRVEKTGSVGVNMKKPDFLIIGASRCGTSSLHCSLASHPEISGPNIGGNKKEVHFFDKKYNLGLKWYYNLFDGEHFNFESTPNYLYDKQCPKRICDALPDIKLIVMLRDPVDRAWSHYINWRMRERWSINILRNSEHEIIKKGIYIEQLLRWLKHIEIERIKIIRSEDFYGNPSLILKKILTWLGLKASCEVESIYFDPVNEKQSRPNRIKQKTPKETKRWLKSFYKPYNELLYQKINRDMGWK
jgi:hypothetical protein